LPKWANFLGADRRPIWRCRRDRPGPRGLRLATVADFVEGCRSRLSATSQVRDSALGLTLGPEALQFDRLGGPDVGWSGATAKQGDGVDCG
jgi:hypothetical protein